MVTRMLADGQATPLSTAYRKTTYGSPTPTPTNFKPGAAAGNPETYPRPVSSFPQLNTTPSSSGSSTPSYSAPPPAYVPPPPPTAAYAGPAPMLVPPVPVTANALAGAQNALGESFTRIGGGTAGSFDRERLARGPRSTTSITPEMLMRIARQRFSNQR